MIQRFLATKPEYLSAATLLLAGVEQGNVSNEEFIEDVARSECVYHRNSRDFAPLILPEEVLYVGNTKFSDQWVEGPKFLSLQEYSASPKPIFFDGFEADDDVVKN